jgi:CubicO group peptidase (beta-lactamase class C family)
VTHLFLILPNIAQITIKLQKASIVVRRGCLLATLMLTLILPMHAQAEGPDDFAAVMAEQIPGLLAQHHVPGAVAAYIQDGAVTWTHAYGIADLSSGATMRPEMIFNFGSCGKVLSAWGVMRLVEEGKIELDAPANQYLKRWQIASTQFDASQVTVRRLLSHTAGLSVRGLSDYGPRRNLPGLVQVLEGENQSGGRVTLQWQPGGQFIYSGGGYTVLQMIVEDVSGEPFDAFMTREVTGPLGMDSLHWAWTAELIGAAATPYGSQNEPVGYRQLAAQAVGSEVGTVTDFARFIAAAVPGPNNEPAGRGVLKPETLQQMLAAQPATQGSEGLGYGIASIAGDTMLMHFGENPGWNAFFILDTRLGEGLVFASNSSNGFPLNTAVEDLWVQNTMKVSTNVFPPVTDRLGLAGKTGLGIAAVFGFPLIMTVVVFSLQVTSGKRRLAQLSPVRLMWAIPWAALALFWWYWIYAPFHLALPPSFPDLWPLPQTALVLGVLLAWVALSTISALFPMTMKVEEERKRSSRIGRINE